MAQDTSAYHRPHVITTPPGNLNFMLLDARPKSTDLQLPGGDGLGGDSEYLMSDVPTGDLDPIHCWNDVIKIVNLRTHGPGTWTLRVAGLGGDITQHLVATAPSSTNSIFGDGTDRPQLLEVTQRNYRWSRKDIIQVRNALRMLNGEIRFKRLSKLWSVDTIHDLLEPRWQISDWITVNKDPNDTESTSSTRQDIYEIHANQFACTYQIDFKDGYGARFISAGLPGIVLPPNDLLERYALEDSFVGNKPDKINAVVLEFNDRTKESAPGADTTRTVKHIHLTSDGNGGTKQVIDSEATWVAVGGEIPLNDEGEGGPAES